MRITPYAFVLLSRRLYAKNGISILFSKACGKWKSRVSWSVKIMGYDLWWGWRSGGYTVDDTPHYKYGLHFAFKGTEETSCEKKGFNCYTLIKV